MDKYYTPELKEFRVGFEYEMIYKLDAGDYWRKEKFHSKSIFWPNIENAIEDIRVKHLDRSDIESCGFTYTDKCTISNRDCYKILPDKTIYQISPYFSFRHEERENLVRIYKGELHNYPYQEIFRGDIKNISELKMILEMLNIDYE